MKLIVMTLVFFLWSLARAEANVIIEMPAHFWRTEAKAMFEINRIEGRAWVVVEAHDASMPRRDRFYSHYRQKIPGLSFDKATSKIMLEQDGAITECAKVQSRGRSIFRYDQVTPTNCRLKVTKIMKDVDNGYEVRKIEYIQVHLNTL